ncbi:MAG TPA: hemolysin family protein, partial [Actinotalea sp.]|nr:hemolysin family protein [Actinotalea sp.]
MIGLLGVAAVLVALSAGLAAGEHALRRVSRATLAAMVGPTPSGRRIARLGTDPAPVADAAGVVRVGLEAVAVVVALVVVRLLPFRIAGRHPAATVLGTSALLVGAVLLAGRWHRAERHELSDDELRDMVDRASESDAIEADDRDLFRSVLELGETLTRAVMVPRTEMVTIRAGTPVRKALALFLRSGFSRAPLVGTSVDDVLGVLYLKDLVRHRHLVEDSDNQPVDELARPAVFVPESKPVDDLLRWMQQGSSHLALVVDEFGGIAGLVTIEDALEEIVGELVDEHDRSAPEVEQVAGGFRVPARLPVDELGELFDLSLEDEDVDTVGGLLAKALGKVPLAGARAVVGPLVLVAERVEGRRKRL